MMLNELRNGSKGGELLAPNQRGRQLRRPLILSAASFSMVDPPRSSYRYLRFPDPLAQSVQFA